VQRCSSLPAVRLPWHSSDAPCPTPSLLAAALVSARAASVSKTFVRRLVWRDLAYWQLHHWPDMATEPIRTAYRDVEWAGGPEAAAALAAWQHGQTGFPIVDAGAAPGAMYLCSCRAAFGLH
jgi:hypothetical protein